VKSNTFAPDMRNPIIHRNRSTGYAFAFLATIAGSTVYIFSKAALNEVSLPQFGVYWFSLALVWNIIFIRATSGKLFTAKVTNHALYALGRIGIYELVATTCFYAAIAQADNAAVPSFLRNSEYIFVTLLGVYLLGEKFGRREIAGILMTFTGVLVISFQKNASFGDYLHGSSGLMLVSTAFYALRTLGAKKNIEDVTPSALAINRALFLLAFALISLLVMRQSWIIPQKALLNIAIGSFFGPFLTSIGQYSALKYFEASRTAIIQSTTALFVLLGAYLYFGRLPLMYQVIGGLFTIAGTVLLMSGSLKRLRH
jgi:drug/metabolite transporter (DMT)-like permease